MYSDRICVRNNDNIGGICWRINTEVECWKINKETRGPQYSPELP